MVPPPTKAKASTTPANKTPSYNNSATRNPPPKNSQLLSNQPKIKPEPLKPTAAVSGTFRQPRLPNKPTLPDPVAAQEKRKLKDAYTNYLQQGVLNIIANKMSDLQARKEATMAKEAAIKSEVAGGFSIISEKFPAKRYTTRMLEHLIQTNEILDVYNDFVQMYAKEKESSFIAIQRVLEPKLSGINQENMGHSENECSTIEQKEDLKKTIANLQRHLLPQVETSRSSLQLLQSFTEALKQLIPVASKVKQDKENAQNLNGTLMDLTSLEMSLDALKGKLEI